MGSGFLIDTNVLIDVQTKKLHENGLRFVSDIINDEFNVSFVTYIEYLGYNSANVMMREFIDLANITTIDKLIIEETIRIRKLGRIKLPDALLAATAIIKDFVLVTRNINDFRNIPGISLENPWDR